jgi:putative NADH-flavin reductase
MKIAVTGATGHLGRRIAQHKNVIDAAKALGVRPSNSL